MIYLSLSPALVQRRINAILDFIEHEETGESRVEKLNNAWYELFGMQEILAGAKLPPASGDQAQQRFAEIMALLAQTLLAVEQLYEQATQNQRPPTSGEAVPDCG